MGLSVLYSLTKTDPNYRGTHSLGGCSQRCNGSSTLQKEGNEAGFPSLQSHLKQGGGWWKHCQSHPGNKHPGQQREEWSARK